MGLWALQESGHKMDSVGWTTDENIEATYGYIEALTRRYTGAREPADKERGVTS